MRNRIERWLAYLKLKAFYDNLSYKLKVCSYL